MRYAQLLIVRASLNLSFSLVRPGNTCLGAVPLAIHLVESIMHQRCAEVYLDFICFNIGFDTSFSVHSTVDYSGEYIHGSLDVVGWVSYPRGLFSL